MGACLLQFDGDIPIPIAFISSRFNDAQLRYSVTDKEGLAVCWAALKFTPLILQCPQLIVDTDHEALL
eukprot:Awhi_evm3s11156